MGLNEHQPALLFSILAGRNMPEATRPLSVEIHVDKVRKAPIWRTEVHGGAGKRAWDNGHVVLAGPAADWKGHAVLLVLAQDSPTASVQHFECQIGLTNAIAESVPAQWYEMAPSSIESPRRRSSFFASRMKRSTSAAEAGISSSSTPHIFAAVTLLKPDMFMQRHAETERLNEDIKSVQAHLHAKNAEVDRHLATIEHVETQRKESEREFAALIEQFMSTMRQAADEKSKMLAQIAKLQAKIAAAEQTGMAQTETIRAARGLASTASSGKTEEPRQESLSSRAGGGGSPRFLEPTLARRGKMRAKNPADPGC